MATDDVLELTDGTTTVDLLRGPVRVAQDGWAPQVASRRVSELGNTSLWADVEEELQLEVIADAGDNPGETWTALQRLLAQGQRWRRGDPDAAPVRLRARPAGSRLPGGVVLEAPVYGGAVPGLHSSYPRMLEGGAVPAVNVRVQRGGLWLHPTLDTATGTSGSTAQNVFTATLATHPTESPIEVAIRVAASGLSSGVPTSRRGLLLVAKDANAFQIANAESLGGVSFTSVAVTGARNGAVLGTNATTTTPQVTGNLVITTPTRAARIYVLARSLVAEHQVRAYLFNNTGATSGSEPIYTSYARVPVGGPMLIDLGSVRSFAPLDRLRLQVPSMSTAAGQQLQIDSVFVVNEELGPIYGCEATLVVSVGGSTTFAAMTISTDPLALAAPRVTRDANATPFVTPYDPISYRGDVSPYLAGTTVAVLWASYTDAAFLDVNPTYELRVRRRRGYLALE